MNESKSTFFNFSGVLFLPLLTVRLLLSYYPSHRVSRVFGYINVLPVPLSLNLAFRHTLLKNPADFLLIWDKYESKIASNLHFFHFRFLVLNKFLRN